MSREESLLKAAYPATIIVSENYFTNNTLLFRVINKGYLCLFKITSVLVCILMKASIHHYISCTTPFLLK